MKVNIVSLTCCAGCVSSFLNAGDALLEILSQDFDIVYSPTFVDLKEVPQVDLAIVEGGVRTEADEKLIREVRAKSRVLVALGICATHGGVTSLGNIISVKKLLEKEYFVLETSKLPELEDLMYPICNFVDVDYYIPGCPPMPFLIVHSLKSIVSGKTPIRHQSVVCTECNRKIIAAKLDRLYGIYDKEADPNLCLVSQGFVCLGSLTREGCGAPCPRAGFTCFGCRGPTDSLLYRSRDLYSFLVKVISKRTSIPEEEVKKELYRNPFIFHTFIFSKFERFKARERII
ncbi:MAG: F420-nonreducing hydrogenase [Candidatus Bathyarchaeota archaeon]|nr:F420-nonreducing hydrogenase [Candidatus Bathyarchaeota archaeon A05DMB-5]MDH7557679.1 F420-nonreducing hydrogenase [Candidatus Bathyarchaeota archaeon]